MLSVLALLPDSVIVGIYGGVPVKEAVLKAGGRRYVVKAKGGRLLVNGVKRRRLVLKNVRLLKPVRGDYPGLFIIKPKKGGFIMLNKVPREEYIADVIASEIGNAPLEALKAQAVLARTFLMRWGKRHGTFHACDRDHCQRYEGRNRVKPIHRKAARATRGLVLTYRGKPVEVLYHASCGGWVCEPRYVWRGGKRLPYFWTGEDEDCFEDDNAHYTWKVFAPLKSCPRVKRIPGSLRAYMMIVEGDTLYAYDMRRRFNLPSTVFAYWCTETGVIFLGTGRGHGVGLCQRGTILKARKGWDFKKILKFYYRGTTVRKVGR